KLNEEYVDSLAKGNFFILKRIEKYTRRGFKVKVPSLTFYSELRQKNIEDIEKWACKKFLSFVMDAPRLIEKDFKKFTYEELERKMATEGFKRVFIPLVF